MSDECCMQIDAVRYGSVRGVPSDHTTEPSTSQTSTHIPSEVSSQSSEPTTSTTPTHPQTDSSIVTTPAFEVKGLLYKDQGARPHIWTDDLLNPLTEIYQNLSQSFCRLVLDSLRLGNPDIAKDAKCHKVVFTPVTIFYYQKRQVDATGNSSENSTQGVQASSEIQLVSPNATELNQTEFNNILVTGYNQVNSSSELQLSNVETNVVIPDSTTIVQLTKTSIQTQFEEFTTNQHVISTESQISTELYKFSSLGVHSDSTSIPPVTDITQSTQSDQTTSTSHLIDTTPTISTTAFQSTESTTLQTPVSTPVSVSVSTSQHTPESTSQPSPQSTLMQTGTYPTLVGTKLNKQY
ncbi:unnamed protein product [Schistosoma guineensis]|nr:unnamed protein product [Schistosoma guineensis]